MISKLKGQVTYKDEKSVILDVAGVGYRVFASFVVINSLHLNQEVDLWTHLAVRENALDLYGFGSKEELDFFELLLGVSGIGPKSALAILNIASIDSLKRGVMEGDIAYLTKVSGIGKRNAEKIIIELRDKLGDKSETEGSTKEEVEVIEALKALGYSPEEAREALRGLPAELSGVSEKVKHALKNLGSK